MRRGLLALLLLAAAGEAAAQDPRQRAPVRPQPDSVPADSARERPVVQDSVIDRLLELEGYVPVEYQGDSAQFDNRTRTLRLRGNPVVVRQDQRLTATDSIVYREQRNFVEAYGSPQATGEGQDIVGDVMFYDLGGRRAMVRGARTTLTEGATWYVRGDVTSEEQGERIYASGSTFTSDDREDPAYYFRADRVKVVRNRVLVGRPAYLYFRGVPVFVLPFIVQDLERGRRSGILIPEFEINDIIRTDAVRGERGTGRHISNIGYYWAINEYMGAQAALDWRSQSWLGLQVGYQFNSRRRFLNGAASLTTIWRNEGGQERTLTGSGSWQPDERTSLGTSINYASNTRFERERTVDPFRQTARLSSTASFSRRMDWATVSSGAELGQEISSGDNNLSTNVAVNPQPISLFPAGAGVPRWYNDGALTLNASGSHRRASPGDALLRRRQPTETNNAGVSGQVRLGPVGVSMGATYTGEWARALQAIDSAAAAPEAPRGRLGELPETGRRTLDWNAGTGYEFRLIGATRLTPSISLGQRVVRLDSAASAVPDSVDARRWGSFVAAPMRVSFGSSLRTELFGFYPGVGGYEAIRHRVSPSLNYSFAPEVRQDTIQTLVFGRDQAREINAITFGFDQTWEAKLRAPRPRTEVDRGAERAGPGNPTDASLGNPGAQSDTATATLAPEDPRAAQEVAAADADAGGGSRAPAEAQQSQKITLVAINTSALAYSFVPVDTTGRRFQTDQLSNTIRSDLMGGFTVTVSHSLFDTGNRGILGGGVGGQRRFSPFLTGVQTSLSFGANSALFRWLGFARADEGERHTERGRTDPDQGVPTAEPPGAQTFTNNPMFGGGMGGPMGMTGPGGGAWNVSLNYSLRRERPLVGDVPAARDRGNQQLTGNLTFYPSRNWAVNWYTDYSITQNEFGTHVVNLKRDLYRWQANFNFTRAPNGNTAFSFSVHLSDLPDLKADYRRSNLGADRPVSAQ